MINQCRRIATRYDKLAANDLAFVKLAAIRIWLRANAGRSHNDANDPYPPFSLKTNSSRMPAGVRTNKRLSLSSGRSMVE